MSRRGNGLEAQAYTPVAELDTAASDAILAALREAGVAAYVLPAPPPARDPSLGGGPADGADGGRERLFVDALSRERAERVLADRLVGTSPREPEGPAEQPEQEDSRMRDEDAVWQEIIAGFDRVPGGDTPWPDRENVSADNTDAPDETRVRIIRPAEPPRAQPDLGDDDLDAADDEDEHFVPPPPPPLPSADAGTKFAWVALFGGPGYLLLAAAMQWEVPGWAAFLAVAAFIGGFVALVMRMGDDRGNDSGPDNGAVV